MISRIDHVSIAVPDAERAREFFTRLIRDLADDPL